MSRATGGLPPHQLLERAMEERSRQLGMGWTDLAAASGVNVQTLRDIRSGKTRRIRLVTQHAIEDALEWEHGSIAAILTGGEPTPKIRTHAPLGLASDVEQAALILYGAMQVSRHAYREALDRVSTTLDEASMRQVLSLLTDMVLDHQDESAARRRA